MNIIDRLLDSRAFHVAVEIVLGIETILAIAILGAIVFHAVGIHCCK